MPGLPAGRYPYHCALHPAMRGVLEVRDWTVHRSALGMDRDLGGGPGP